MTRDDQEAYKRARMGRVLDIIFPLECVACGAPRSHACSACLASVALAPKFFWAGAARSAAGFAYAHPLVRRLLHDAKYEGWRCALEPLETLMRRWAEKSSGLFPEEAVVTAVPLHPARLRARGFNQAETLARVFADATDRRSALGFLERIRRTRPQTEARDRDANVRGAFAARALPPSLRGRPFLLVDDVRTSGATMDGCAEVLRAAGAREVHAVALAWGSGTKEDAGT